MARQSDPIFTISLEKGLADRHRLPVAQVISVLNEVRQMLIETGREIQKERGRDQKFLDFGLELVADEEGRTFTKGSLKAKIAITANVEVGVEAAERVLNTISVLGAPKKPIARLAQKEPYRAKIINRLDRIAFVHEQSRTEAKFRVSVPKAFRREEARSKAQITATFGSVAVKRLSALREPVFSEESVSLYGKLTELKDRSQIDDSHGKFWGELRRDNGERWRVEFSDKDQAHAVPLFREQVRITGTAHYFQTKSPKIVADNVELDEQRDY